jgi:hypothetical protein
VDNRPLGGCVFGERSKPKTAGAEYVLIYQNAQNVGRFGFAGACSAPAVGEYADATAQRSVAHLTFCRCVFRSTVFGLLRSPKTQPPSGRLPTLRFASACSAPLFSACSARRKRNRLAVGCPPYVLPVRVPPPLSASTPTQPPSGRLPTLRFAGACSAPTVGEYADATAQRSVDHLTFLLRGNFFTTKKKGILKTTKTKR